MTMDTIDISYQWILWVKIIIVVVLHCGCPSYRGIACRLHVTQQLVYKHVNSQKSSICEVENMVICTIKSIYLGVRHIKLVKPPPFIIRML